MSNFQDLDIFAGESRLLTLYARDPSNNPQDLTGKDVFFRMGWPVYTPDQTTPVLEKDCTVLNAVAGTFTVQINPPDTMPFEGDYVYTAITITDGEIVFQTNSLVDIEFDTNDGTAIEWVNDFDDHNMVVSAGTVHIRRSVLR